MPSAERQLPADGIALESVGPVLDEVCRALHAATGRDVSGYRPATVARAVLRRMAATGAGEPRPYLERLLEDRAEAGTLLNELFISVTAFFRDPQVFQSLEQHVLPGLAEEARGRALRVWVPGCATGEEAYSLAMLLVEIVDRTGAAQRPVIFCTDIDADAVAAARAGRFLAERCSSISSARLDRFFRRDGVEYVATKELREACLFSVHDLGRDPPFSRLDLISCRNVLIYFQPSRREHAVQALHAGLRAGGVLVLGTAEALTRHDGLFETIDPRLRLFRRRWSGSPAPRRALVHPLDPPHVVPAAAAAGAGAETTMVTDYERVLLREIAPACVVVDANGNALHFSGPVSRYLEPHGAPSTHLLDLAREHLRFELRAALRDAAHQKRAVTVECSATEADGRRELTEIVVRPLPSLSGPAEDRCLVAFRPVRGAAEPARGGATGADADPLRAELLATRQRLQATIDELEASNDEHRRANERLRSLNEELQTSQEELESLNEELQTVNAELGSKVEDLDRANADLQNLFRSTDVAVLFLGKDLEVKRFTPATTRLFRLIDADVGRPLADVSARFPVEPLLRDARDVLSSRTPREQTLLVPGVGRWYALRVLPYFTSGGDIDGAVVTFADITEAKLAEAASRESENRLRQIVDSIPHLVWTADGEGRRDYFSQQWREYTGLSAGPQLDERWIEAYHPDDRPTMLAAWAESVATGRPFEAEYRIRGHDGAYRWFRARASALHDAMGRIDRWIGTSTDVDEIRRLASTLRDGSRKKDEFLALLGHELRNPLAAISNSLELLRRQAFDADRVGRTVAVLDRQLSNLTRLVDDLLDVSRITRGKVHIRRERIDLSAHLASIVDDHRDLFASAGLDLAFEAAPELWISGDPARVAQIAGNLLHNARKFTDRGGRVRVELARAADGQAVLRVADTGMGMDPASVERMFEPFEQADVSEAHGRGGLGLGLTLVKALAELHGGSVRGRSAGLGLGAEFEVRLPLLEANRTAAERSPGLSGRRILVVDDNVDAAQTLADLLRLSDNEVWVATDGRSALEQARRVRPDLALCDIGLPGELDGYALARALRREPGLERTVLVAVTGYAAEEDQRRTRAAGFALHFAKPVKMEDVQRALARLPDGAGGAGTGERLPAPCAPEA